MKKVFRFLAGLFIFALVATGFYSVANVHSLNNISSTSDDSVSKKGITLTGAQEVPAVSPSGSGTLNVSYDKSTKTLTYNATWTGMTGSVTMMHFHGPVKKGKNAGVVYPIPDFTPGMAGTASGTVKVDEVKIKEADLLGGKLYYNIHTKTYPAGEIRGQVEF